MALNKENKIELEVYASELCEKQGCFLYEIDYLNGSKLLRVYIDKEGGVDIENCAEISRELSAFLDEKGYFQQAYELEVSSPGLERILMKEWHYKKVLGENIQIKLYESLGKLIKVDKKWEKTKNIKGKLISFEPEALKIEVEGAAYELSPKDIAKANVVFEMDKR